MQNASVQSLPVAKSFSFEEFANWKKAPEFIKGEPFFQKHRIFAKIFPWIGLRNFRLDLNHIEIYPEFCDFQAEKMAKARLNETASPLRKWIAKLDYHYISGYKDPSLRKLQKIANKFIASELAFVNCNERKIPKRELIFSGDNIACARDIMTMSMRGITSCQAWHSGHSRSLIGSIVDPCCAICYITENNQLEYGVNMNYRAVIRFVVSSRVGPALFIDRIYRSARANNELAIRAIIASELMKRTKLPVFSTGGVWNIVEDDMFIPSSQVVLDLPSHLLSYRDCQLPYRQLTRSIIDRFPLLKKLQNYFIVRD